MFIKKENLPKRSNPKEKIRKGKEIEKEKRGKERKEKKRVTKKEDLRFNFCMDWHQANINMKIKKNRIV